MPGRRNVTLRVAPGGYKRQIERLAGEVGKGVVIEGVEVGEIHRAAHRDGQHVGFEGLVLLLHFRAFRARVAGAPRPTGSSHRTTPA